MSHLEQSPDTHRGEDIRSVDVASEEQDEEVDEMVRQLIERESRAQAPRTKRNWPRWILERRAAEAARAASRAPDVPAKSGEAESEPEAESEADEWRRIEAEMAKRDRRLDFERDQAERRALAGAVAGPPPNDELETMLLEILGDEYANADATTANPAAQSEAPTTEALDETVSPSREGRRGDGHSTSHSDLSPPRSDEPISPEDVTEAEPSELEEKLQALTSGTQHMRWTRDAFRAQRELKQTRPLVRELSKHVFGVAWLPTSGTGSAKKFPFLIKSISSCKKGCNAFKEEWELSPQIHPERMIPAPLPTRPIMPAWEKLPAHGKRAPELSEVVAGARFTSIAFRGDITPQDWAHSLPGSDVLCISIDLHGESAERFLSGEHGNVGKSLKRRLLRRLDHRGQFSDFAVGAIWTKPSASSDAVRIFMMFQKDDPGCAEDVELEDRNLRFWMSLQRHKVPVSSDGMPLTVNCDQLAPYLGMTEAELEDRWDVVKCYDGDEPEIDEYTPEEGFPAPHVLDQRREHSYRKWAHFVSRHGLPAWISPSFMRLVRDYFCFAPGHVKKRNQLIAAKKKYKFARYGFTKAQHATLKRLKLMELPRGGEICIFRCSPAQFAAIAVRDGEVLGEYFDSAHKAGRSKGLYEAIRKEWSADA